MYEDIETICRAATVFTAGGRMGGQRNLITSSKYGDGSDGVSTWVVVESTTILGALKGPTYIAAGRHVPSVGTSGADPNG
jgi:hypothetical protein